MSTPIVTLSLREVARLLSFKDVRSVKRWCRCNNVGILSDVSSKSSYVIKSEYEAARLGSVIAYLKTRYGADWQHALSAYQSGDSGQIVCLNATLPEKTHSRRKKITPPGKSATRFLSLLEKSLSEHSTHE